MALDLRRIKIESTEHHRATECFIPGEIERQFSAHRARIGPQRIEPRGKRWRKRCNKSGKLTQRCCRRTKLQLPKHIDAIEMAPALQHHAIRLPALQPVD